MKGKKTEFYKILAGVYSRYPIKELKDRFDCIDLAVIDLDGCLFPGYSQAVLGKFIFLKILLSLLSFRDLKFIPQLLSGGLFITLNDLKKIIGITTPNLEMIDKYEKVMKGISFEYFTKMARHIPPMSYDGAIEAIEQLSKKCKVGIISLGIDIILKEYLRQFKSINFFDSNILRFRKAGNKDVFEGYERTNLKTDKFYKREMLEARLNEFEAKCLLVIGHNDDDIEMAKVAQGTKGLSIGFNVSSDIEDVFDIKIEARNWHPIHELIQLLSLG